MRKPADPDIVRVVVGSLGVGILSLTLPVLIERLFDFIIPQGIWSMVLPLGAALAGVAMGIGVLSISIRRAALRSDMRTHKACESQTWNHLLTLPLRFFQNSHPMETGHQVKAASERIRIIAKRRAQLYPACALMLANTIFLIAHNRIFAVGSLLFVIGFAAASLFASARRKSALANERIARIHLQSRMDEWVCGISKIRMAGAEFQIASRWRSDFRELNAWMHRSDTQDWTLRVLRGSMVGLSGAGLIMLASWTHTSTGNALALFCAYGVLMVGAHTLIEAWWKQSEIRSLEALSRPITETAPEVSGKTQDIGPLRGELEIQNLHFQYEPGTPWVLGGIHATIRAGEFVGLAGASGCGKSTLLRLILGLHTAQKGDILIDGYDLRSLDPARFRSQIGVVFQNPILFPGDVYQNLCGDMQHPFRAVWEALEMAGLAEDIYRLPLQLHTMVGLRGENFSAGQRQRMALARALLMQPKVLLLDEATSALDTRTQTKLLNTLAQLSITRILVTHRLSALKFVERVLVFHDGRITETGTCDDLLATDGIFRSLVRKQLG